MHANLITMQTNIVSEVIDDEVRKKCEIRAGAQLVHLTALGE